MSATRIGMVRCEHCGRQFNPHSAARHIPWCEKQKQERNKHRLSQEKRQALERYRWRIGYRPTNQLNSNQRGRLIGSTIDNHFAGGKQANNNNNKRSSVNSSATLSSPSASSSASFGATSSIVSINDGSRQVRAGGGQNGAKATQQRGQQQQQQQLQNPVGQLQRSISSLTLTKKQQHGSDWGQNIDNDDDDDGNGGNNKQFVNNGPGRGGGGGGPTMLRRQQMRTKSTNDLSNMGEMVETLAKRVDEIYAQNQLLLASLPNKANATTGAVSSASVDNNSLMTDSDNGTELVKCHHCKASCFEEANYCHRCGCKLRLASRGSSPG